MKDLIRTVSGILSADLKKVVGSDDIKSVLCRRGPWSGTFECIVQLRSGKWYACMVSEEKGEMTHFAELDGSENKKEVR